MPDQTSLAESRRLDLLESHRDPHSRRYLDDLGVSSGWRCLEVGAGRGSIARWLARRVGPTGHVVAVDLNPIGLDGSLDRHLEVLCADVLEVELAPKSFDLVHARALLAHLPERQRAIERMVAWLRPSAYLVIEDADWMSLVSGTDTPSDNLWRAFQRAVPTIDFRVGRDLPGYLRNAGLVDIDVRVDVDVVRGGTSLAELYVRSAAALGQIAVGAGTTTSERIADYQEKLRMEHHRSFGLTWVTASGRRRAL